MFIAHLAISVIDIERMKDFYSKYFQARAGNKYINQAKNFESYFLYMESGVNLELMRRADCQLYSPLKEVKLGFHHLAFSVGSKENVDRLTSLIEKDGYLVANHPRVTGDGYYESVITDPEGNLIEITV